MKVTILQGSVRKKGNTARILTWVEKELTGLGHPNKVKTNWELMLTV